MLVQSYTHKKKRTREIEKRIISSQNKIAYTNIKNVSFQYLSYVLFFSFYFFAPTSILQRKYSELNLTQMEMVLRWKKECYVEYSLKLSTRFLFIYSTTKLMETSDARSASIYNRTFLDMFFDAFSKKPYQWKSKILFISTYFYPKKNILRFLSQNFAIRSYFFRFHLKHLFFKSWIRMR